MSKYLTTSLVTVGVLVGIGAGYVISPQYAVMNDRDAAMVDLGRADKYFDQRYIEAMIVHHRGAMQLAEQVKDQTKRSEIKSLAEEILRNEPKAIDQLYSWRQDWYGNGKKVEDKPVTNLGSYDEKLDLRFLNALIKHHEDGLMMTDDAHMKSTRNDILNNADETEEFFNTTLKTFEEWRNEWYFAAVAPAANNPSSN